MSNYYEKRDAKVRIAHELMNLGWKVYGYKANESDSMTDYYSPADWDGIATKNGYVLVVDNKYSNMSGKEITKYNPNYIAMSSADHSKIESLKNMTTSNGATEGEQENAQKLIEKLQAKYSNQTESRYEVIGHYPTYMNTTKGSIWHLEKDGALADKGNKLTIFDDMPDSYIFDINNMEFTDRYKKQWTGNYENGCRVMEDRQLTDEERKAVNEFKSFILRIERIVNFGNSCGDGTQETEEAFQQQNENEKMVKKTIIKTKKVTKPVQVQKDSIQVGDYVNYKGNRATYCYWKVINVNEERGTFTYEATGKKYQELKNGKRYYNNLSKLNELYDIFELQEVEEVETVEKWVKVKATKKETVKAETFAEVKTESTTNNDNIEFEVKADINEKTGEKIFVAKLTKTYIKEEWNEIYKKIKSLGGWYYKYKGFIFKEDPTELLKNNFSQSESAEQKEKNIFNDIDLESVAGYIVESSGVIIEQLNLSKSEYWNNEEYKEKLLQTIKDRKLTKNQFNSVIDHIEQHEEYKEYKRLIEVLKGFYALDNSNKNNSNKPNNKEKNISKIDKQLESNNNKIEKLSGDYLTNTWKRMNEQANRDSQRQALEKDNLILEYIKNKINIENFSGFEKALITRTLRDDFKGYYNSYKSNIKYNKEINSIFPSINPNWNINDSWSQDQLKRIKRLKEIELTDDRQLKNCLKNDYQEIINSIENKNNFSEVEQKIKKLEREYKMQQKGDINFTPKELTKLLIDYADIKESDRVLEPTAGIGNIADQLKDYTNNIDCIEYMYNYNELLKLKGFNVVGSDFMECTNYNTYNKIIANFPFSKEIDMIKHAYKMLKADGKMVVVTSNHWTFANDKESINFREWLNNLTYEVYESNINFEFTNVNYKILIIDKDENINSIAV